MGSVSKVTSGDIGKKNSLGQPFGHHLRTGGLCIAAAGTRREPQGLQVTEAVMCTVPSDSQISQGVAHFLRPCFCVSLSFLLPQCPAILASAATQLQTHQALLLQDLCICCRATSSNVLAAYSFPYFLYVLSHASLLGLQPLFLEDVPKPCSLSQLYHPC